MQISRFVSAHVIDSDVVYACRCALYRMTTSMLMMMMLMPQTHCLSLSGIRLVFVCGFLFIRTITVEWYFVSAIICSDGEKKKMRIDLLSSYKTQTRFVFFIFFVFRIASGILILYFLNKLLSYLIRNTNHHIARQFSKPNRKTTKNKKQKMFQRKGEEIHFTADES